eukprot:2787916-Alexandrium_andersonii.AAC.1
MCIRDRTAERVEGRAVVSAATSNAAAFRRGPRMRLADHPNQNLQRAISAAPVVGGGGTLAPRMHTQRR